MARVKSTEEIREYWNRFADNYEKNYNQNTIQVNTILLPLLHLSPDHVVAECGCGTGSGVELLQKACPNLSKVLANDLSEVILEKAKSKNLENVEYFVASNEALPYESNSCDRYISNLSLQLVENPRNMLSEALRVLRPNGLAVFSVWGKTEEFNFFTVVRRCLNAIEVEPPKERNNFHLNKIDELNQMAREVGFVNVRGFYSAVPMLAHSSDDLINLALASPDVIAIKNSDEEKYERYIEVCRNEFTKIWNDGHAITFDFLVLIGQKN